MKPNPKKGTIAQVAIQCSFPGTTRIGSFLYTAEAPGFTLTRQTQVFDNLVELFTAINKSGWKDRGDGAYVFEGRQL